MRYRGLPDRGLLVNGPHVPIQIGNMSHIAPLNTGARHSYIDEDLLRDLGLLPKDGTSHRSSWLRATPHLRRRFHGSGTRAHRPETSHILDAHQEPALLDCHSRSRHPQPLRADHWPRLPPRRRSAPPVVPRHSGPREPNVDKVCRTRQVRKCPRCGVRTPAISTLAIWHGWATSIAVEALWRTECETRFLLCGIAPTLL